VRVDTELAICKLTWICRQLAWEIIVVDDASPDGTQEVARQLAGVYGADKIVGHAN
jgi:glycosyltransferase involved in cell wall biosynthesis